MPQSGSIDIPHVSVHDHYIKKPVKKEKLLQLKEFAGIYCVNTIANKPTMLAQANLNYYEKFEGEAISLDTAYYWIQKVEDQPKQSALWIHHYYLKNDWNKIVELAAAIDLSISSDAWLCYRIGQAYQNIGKLAEAEFAFARAVKIAHENVSFINKLAVIKLQQQNFGEAIELFQSSLNKQPKQVEALVNIGFAYANAQDVPKAMQCYHEALKLDPDFQQALLNRAALHVMTKNIEAARADLRQILLLNPEQEEVKRLLKSLN